MMDALDHDHKIYTTNDGDKSLLVKFYTAPQQDMDATKKEGRPIFKDVEMIDIRIPGNKDNIVVRPVRESDKQRFPEHYRLFKNRVEGAKEEMVGMPLVLWPEVTAAQVEEFKYFNVRTVEQLAGIPDSTAQKFVGIQDLRRKATAFLEAANKKAPLSKMRGEIETLQKQMQALAETNERLQKANERLQRKLEKAEAAED